MKLKCFLISSTVNDLIVASALRERGRCETHEDAMRFAPSLL